MSQLDLNLIRTFLVLYETRSVTGAAERLFVTQPSVSYALARLRDLLDDPLFVRGRDGMRPSHKAQALYPTFRQALDNIENAIENNDLYEPARSDRRFRLAMTDLGEMTLLPSILQRIHTLAPAVELEVISLEIDHVADWLATGQIDAAICSRRIPGNAVERLPLVPERYVCAIAERFAPATETLTLPQFLHCHHAVVTRISGHGMAEEVLNGMGVQRKISLEVPHFSVLPALLQQSPLLVILPLLIARNFARSTPLRIFELPFPVPSFEVALHWQQSATHSPAQRWFRQVIIDAAGSGHGD